MHINQCNTFTLPTASNLAAVFYQWGLGWLRVLPIFKQVSVGMAAQMKPLFEFCLKTCCIVWSWFSSSLHMDVVVISLPTEPMCALHILLFGVNVCSRILWNAVLSFARCKSCCSTKRSTILSNCDQVYMRILCMCVCLPGFCVGGCGTCLTHTDKSKVGNL